MSNRFHLAIPVGSIEESKKFYCDFLGCEAGSFEEGKWQDINFWGNELTLHSSEEFEKVESKRHNVDMGNVTVPHFGVHISAEDFANLKERLAEHKIKYIDEPYVRFEGTELEQETMFIADPYGNAMEIKTMKNPDMLWRINK